MDDNGLFILYGQYHGCDGPGDTLGQSNSSHNFKPNSPEIFRRRYRNG